MKALVCRELGPVTNLALEEYPEPELKPGHLLIANTIAGVNFPDGLVIEGKHVFKPQPPFVPGAEAAGRVIAVGEGVSGFRAGDYLVLPDLISKEPLGPVVRRGGPLLRISSSSTRMTRRRRARMATETLERPSHRRPRRARVAVRSR